MVQQSSVSCSDVSRCFTAVAWLDERHECLKTHAHKPDTADIGSWSDQCTGSVKLGTEVRCFHPSVGVEVLY